MDATPLGSTTTGQFLPAQDSDEAEHDYLAEDRFGFEYPNQQQRSQRQPDALVEVESDNTFHSTENSRTISETR